MDMNMEKANYNRRRWLKRSGGGFNKIYYFSVITFALLHLADSSPPPPNHGSPGGNPNDLSNKFQPQPQSQQQRPKFSSKIPAQTFRRKQQTAAGGSGDSEPLPDFSAGFPSGFTQGLPTFDFSRPMTAEATSSSDGKGGDPTTADTENVGFVHGPPDGFPTLEQLGGKFPGFGNMPQHSPNSNDGQFGQQYQQQAGSSPYQIQQGGPDEEYLSGPGPSSIHNQVEVGRPGPPPHQLRRPLRPRQRPPQQYGRPEAGGSGSSGNPQFLPPRGAGGPPPPHSHSHPQPKRPLVLKVSGKKVLPTKLPPGPPVFFAPSPDVQSSSQQQDYRPESASPSNHYPQRLRYRRELTPKEVQKVTDQVADGSNPDQTYWEVSSPFILFDTYKSPENLNAGNPAQNNLTVLDHDSGEQRFFPSFPVPNPYVGLPYGGPPARPPLFPGPTANRAPSRYHPQFGPAKYNPQTIPAPNRGPSGVYSAESHDHDRYQDNNLLGSGNFEVIRGGTYYEDDDAYHSGFHGGANDHHGHGDDGDYYHHNGHSSPPGYRAPGTDFFANFRDFADINPPSRSYSHRHETVAVHPAMAAAAKLRQPKNILEKLESSSSSDSTSASSHHSPISREKDPMMATF